VAGSDCASSIQVCALRVARLAADGTTPAGATNLYVTDKLAELAIAPVYDTGDEIDVKGGCGQIIVAYKDPDKLKRLDLTLTMEMVDPELTELVTGSSLITVGGMSMGYALPAVGAAAAPGVSLEAWSKAWIGGGAPPGLVVTDGVLNSSTTVTSATAAFTAADVGRTISGTGIPALATIASVSNATTVIISSAATATATGVTLTIGRPGAYFRYVFPKWIGKFETRTLNSGASPSVYSGPAYENAGWGNGPANDWPSGAVSGRVGAVLRDAALPTAVCGYSTTAAQV